MKFHEALWRREDGQEKTCKRRRSMDDPSLRAAGADEAGEKQGQSAQVPAASGQDTDAWDVTVIWYNDSYLMMKPSPVT